MNTASKHTAETTESAAINRATTTPTPGANAHRQHLERGTNTPARSGGPCGTPSAARSATPPQQSTPWPPTQAEASQLLYTLNNYRINTIQAGRLGLISDLAQQSALDDIEQSEAIIRRCCNPQPGQTQA